MITMGCKFRYTKKKHWIFGELLNSSSRALLACALGAHFSPKNVGIIWEKNTNTTCLWENNHGVLWLWFMVYGYGYCICFPYQSEPNVEPLLWPSQHRSGYPRLPAGRLSTAPLVESKKPPSLFGKLWCMIMIYSTICDAKPERFLPCSGLFNQPCLRSFSGVTTWKFHGTQQ